MAAYRRVCDSSHLQADCQEPGSAPETSRSVIEYGLPLHFYSRCLCHQPAVNQPHHQQQTAMHRNRTSLPDCCPPDTCPPQKLHVPPRTSAPTSTSYGWVIGLGFGGRVYGLRLWLEFRVRLGLGLSPGQMFADDSWTSSVAQRVDYWLREEMTVTNWTALCDYMRLQFVTLVIDAQPLIFVFCGPILKTS